MQIAVRPRHGVNPGHPEFVDEAVLQRAVDPLAATAGLRRVAQDVLDAEAVQGPPDLRELRAIRVGARGRGVCRPAGAIGVERHGETVPLEDGAQRSHDGHHALAAGDELAVEDLLGGVIDHGDQRLLAGGIQRQPGMDAAVGMQQFAETGARLPAAPMPSAQAPLGDQPRPLQQRFDKGIGQRDRMLSPGDLVEVAGIEAQIPLAVQAQDALDVAHRRPLGRGLRAAAVVQAVIAVPLKTPAHPANAAGAPTEDVGHLQPGQRSAQPADNNFLDSHRSLHCLARKGHRHLLDGDISPQRGTERAVISCVLTGGHMMCSLHALLDRLDLSPLRD